MTVMVVALAVVMMTRVTPNSNTFSQSVLSSYSFFSHCNLHLETDKDKRIWNQRKEGARGFCVNFFVSLSPALILYFVLTTLLATVQVCNTRRPSFSTLWTFLPYILLYSNPLSVLVKVLPFCKIFWDPSHFLFLFSSGKWRREEKTVRKIEGAAGKVRFC